MESCAFSTAGADGDGRATMARMRSIPLVTAVAIATLLSAAAPAAARDRGADGQFSERKSAHFVLLQDVDIDRTSGRHGSRRFERDVLDVLERAYDRVGETLGLRPKSRARVVIYDDGVFEDRFAGLFRFSAAGFFDGAIHVRSKTVVDARLVRTLHHEYVHAAIASASPAFAFPGWVNEGVAEWFENLALGKRHLSAGERAVLSQAYREGTWIPLADLESPGFGGLPPNRAVLAYLQSYAAVDYLGRRHGDRSLDRFCDQLIRTRDLHRSLQRTFGLTLAQLEQRIAEEVLR
jgi:hypothetical protein